MQRRIPACCGKITKAKENLMNWDQVKGNWRMFGGRVREQWGKLTDDDLERIRGDREQLLGKLQERYGYAKERAQAELDNWLAKEDRSSPPAP
jgi:uncharacterized protein YjbJ (UPF0337 family)